MCGSDPQTKASALACRDRLRGLKPILLEADTSCQVLAHQDNLLPLGHTIRTPSDTLGALDLSLHPGQLKPMVLGYVTSSTEVCRWGQNID